MDNINKRQPAWKLWLWVSLAVALNLFIGGCYILSGIVWRMSVRNEILNEYMPVRLDQEICPGAIYNDGSASIVFGIINHSDHKQAVTFLLYQHNDSTGEDQLFNIEQVLNVTQGTPKQEIENGVVTINAGEQVTLLINATAKDSSKIKSSRTAPDIEIVTLKQ